MAEYLTPEIETDPQALGDESVAELQTRIPDWEASPGDLETILLYVGAVMSADGRDLLSQVPDAIFRYYGNRLANLPPIDAAPASVLSTWTAIDDAGYTIDAGTTVGIRAAGDELVLFDVEGDVVIPPGSLTTAVGEVALLAQEEGAAGNNLGGAGQLAELVDSLRWVDTITLTADTGGGADAEPDDDYLNRLATELQLQSPRPILPRDFAVLYQRLPNVDRVLAIDLYKPADQPNPGDPEDVNRERAVTVVATDELGEPVDAGTKAEAAAMFETMREVNFEVWLADPTYTNVDVDFTATAYPGWDAAQVEADAIAAVQAYLSPAAWGQPLFTDERQWILDTKVRLGELYEVLNRVDGLWRVDTIAFGESGGAQGVADVDLAGVAPLTRPGAITGAVAAP